MKRVVRTDACHIKAIFTLENECFSDPWSYSSLLNEISNPSAFCFVVLDNDEDILGHVTMRKILDEGHISNLAVSNSARRQGVASLLLHELFFTAMLHKLRALTLEVRSKNTPALALYHKFGFRSFGLRRGYYTKPTDDAIIMWADCISVKVRKG